MLMFGCPECGCKSVIEDCPEAWQITHYDDSGEIVDSESDGGNSAINGRCAECDHKFEADSWRRQ